MHPLLIAIELMLASFAIFVTGIALLRIVFGLFIAFISLIVTIFSKIT